MLRINDTPKMFSWIYDISVLKHSMQGILHAIYGFKRSSLPCPEVSYNLFSFVHRKIEFIHPLKERLSRNILFQRKPKCFKF